MTDLTELKAKLGEWNKFNRNGGMSSALGEYTPDEFWELLDIGMELLKRVERAELDASCLPGFRDSANYWHDQWNERGKKLDGLNDGFEFVLSKLDAFEQRVRAAEASADPAVMQEFHALQCKLSRAENELAGYKRRFGNKHLDTNLIAGDKKDEVYDRLGLTKPDSAKDKPSGEDGGR